MKICKCVWYSVKQIPVICESQLQVGDNMAPARNLIMGTPEQVIKVQFKTNNSFNSTMMASFLPVIVSKKNKQRKICLLLQCITNSHKSGKKHGKNTKMTSSDVPTYCPRPR